MKQLSGVIRYTASFAFLARAWKIRIKAVFTTSILHNEVSTLIYEQFLPIALYEGRHVPAPEPEIIGEGLDFIQAGLDLQKQGVSARKIVITL